MINETWEIEPAAGAGPARFGMSRAALRAELGHHTSFRRSRYAEDLTDVFGPAELILLTCGADEGLHTIELGDPSMATYRGVRLDGPADDVLTALRAAGADPVDSGRGGWTLAGGAVTLTAASGAMSAVTVSAPGPTGGEIFMVEGGATSGPVLSHTIVPNAGIGLVSLGDRRAAVRERLHLGMTIAGGPDAEQRLDHFRMDGLVLRYDPDDRVERIYVTGADHVDHAGVTVLPGRFDDVRQALIDAGHPIVDHELALTIEGAGVQLWLANSQTEGPLPVSTVVISDAGNRPSTVG